MDFFKLYKKAEVLSLATMSYATLKHNTVYFSSIGIAAIF
jgi:hypothetical protein